MSAAERLRAVAAVAGCLWLSGCYTLAPADLESITPPQRVRAQLSGAQAERLAEVLGGLEQVVDGQLVEKTPDGFYLLVRSAVVQEGAGVQALHQRLLISRAGLVGLQRRELDWTRTGLLLGVGAAIAGGVLALSLAGRSGGNTAVPPLEGPSDGLVPAFRVPIR